MTRMDRHTMNFPRVRTGQRVRLISTAEAITNVRTGDRGRVYAANNRRILVLWDNEELFALVPGEDEFVVVTE